MKLSNDQSQALFFLQEFVKRQYDPVNIRSNTFLLMGGAGVGKTEIISRIANDQKYNFIFLTPTKKACVVLTKSLKNKGLHRRVNTLHSFLKYKKEYDTEGNEYFSTTDYDIECISRSVRRRRRRSIICIDECGMITNSMHHWICKFQELSKSLIIFIGDKAQLPPIYTCRCKPKYNICAKDCIPDNKFSLTFDNNGFEMKEVMRTDKPSLLHLNKLFRNVVLRFDDKIKSNIDRLFKDNNIQTLCKDKFKSGMVNNCVRENDIILAFTNKKVKHYNDHVVDKLFPDRKNEFAKGMKIIFNKSSYATIHNLDKYPLRISTSSTFIVNDCEVISKEYHGKKFKVNKVYITADLDNIQYEVAVCKVTSEDAPQFYRTRRDVKKKLKEEIIDSEYSDNAISEMWREFYETAGLLNEPFNVAYATTIHKSQGSTYDNVFVDMEEIESICKDRNLFLKYRLLYTAVSRASQNCQIRWFKPIEYLFEYSESELDSDSD